MIPEEYEIDPYDYEEIYLNIFFKNLPKNYNDLTELEYIYYLVGLYYFQEEQNNIYKKIAEQIGDMFKHIALDLADFRILLLDTNGCVRGVGGSKKLFDIKNLPSEKAKKEVQTETVKEETEEERLERHRKFFASLKSSLSK